MKGDVGMSDEHDNQNGDTERLSRIRLTNAYRVYHEPPDEPELFFLLRIIDDRDTSLREARTKERCLRNLLQQASDERQKWFEEAERFRKVAEAAREFVEENSKPKARPTIFELTAILQNPKPAPINVNPDGSIFVSYPYNELLKALAALNVAPDDGNSALADAPMELISTKTAEGHANGAKQGRAAERAAIVAWLRDQARAHEEEAADLLETAAELIERGEHASGESK
jgi:hypothetical protein